MDVVESEQNLAVCTVEAWRRASSYFLSFGGNAIRFPVACIETNSVIGYVYGSATCNVFDYCDCTVPS
jgi:hypothetical protein